MTTGSPPRPPDHLVFRDGDPERRNSHLRFSLEDLLGALLQALGEPMVLDCTVAGAWAFYMAGGSDPCFRLRKQTGSSVANPENRWVKKRGAIDAV